MEPTRFRYSRLGHQKRAAVRVFHREKERPTLICMNFRQINHAHYSSLLLLFRTKSETIYILKEKERHSESES
jgi:hypothetical protein